MNAASRQISKQPLELRIRIIACHAFVGISRSQLRLQRVQGLEYGPKIVGLRQGVQHPRRAAAWRPEYQPLGCGFVIHGPYYLRGTTDHLSEVERCDAAPDGESLRWPWDPAAAELESCFRNF